MKSRFKTCIHSFRKRMKKTSIKAFGLLEVLIASSTMIVILMAIGQRQQTTNNAALNVKLTSEFNTVVNLVQTLVNDSTNCQTVFSNRSLSQVTPGPISPAQSVAPLLTNGAAGATLLQLGPLGNNLNVTNIEFNNVTPTGTPDQYIVNLHIVASKILPGQMIGNPTLTQDLQLTLQTNPGAGNAIVACQGSNGNDVWQQAATPGSIYYSAGTAASGSMSPLFHMGTFNIVGKLNVMGPMQVRGGGAPGMFGHMGITTGFVGGAGGYGWIQSYQNVDALINPILSNVGIGSLTLPSYTLQVTGTAGLSTGTAWTNASDIRVKDVLGDYEFGLKEVLQLHTVRFQYKKDNALKLPSDKKLVGFIAQDVQNIIPDAIHTNKKNDFLDLNADPIHWAVVNAIQELYGLVQTLNSDELKNRLSNLQIETTKLQEETLSIKHYLCAKDLQSSLCQ